jgi:23S rRNA pseudouridine1911/1915/1917 synthase
MEFSESLFVDGEQERQRFVIGQDQAGQRLDRFLTGALGTLSRATVQQMIVSGGVQVNAHASKGGYVLRAGDSVELVSSTPDTTRPTASPRVLPLDIVYEDDDLLVINKAVGMVVHPAPGHSDDTLVNALLARYPELQGVGDEGRPGIVHRLDKDTSGLLIVAKNGHALTALMEQMQRHEIVKRYVALVEGIVKLDKGSIDAPIGRDARNRQQMTITTRESREARTHFRVLERFHTHTLLLLQLETGRTHQIRVHLKAIGHPVVGDATYGSKTALKGAKLQRQFLHAYQLQFRQPTTGEMISLEAPLPQDLQNVLDAKNIL